MALPMVDAWTDIRDWLGANAPGTPATLRPRLQRHLATAHVVKVFNNITFGHLASLARRPARPTAAPCRSPGTTRPRRRR